MQQNTVESLSAPSAVNRPKIPKSRGVEASRCLLPYKHGDTPLSNILTDSYNENHKSRFIQLARCCAGSENVWRGGNAAFFAAINPASAFPPGLHGKIIRFKFAADGAS